jgi:hypothetical protein
MEKLMQGLSFGDFGEADMIMHNWFYYSLYSNFSVHGSSLNFLLIFLLIPSIRNLRLIPLKRTWFRGG